MLARDVGEVGAAGEGMSAESANIARAQTEFCQPQKSPAPLPESRAEQDSTGIARAGVIVIKVYGIPGPQGSKSFKGMRGGHAILVESSKKVKPWREDVKAAAEAVRAGAAPLDCPLRLHMVFTLPKPASAPKRRKTWPMRTPDLSKLARSTEDALTRAGIWRDDARVVEYGLLAKRYPGEGSGALEAPGVWIKIERMDGPQDLQRERVAPGLF